MNEDDEMKIPTPDSDADGRELVLGGLYRIASAPSCPNRFRCVALHDPNEILFVRQHDGMRHFGREFVEYRDGARYYDVSAADEGDGA